MWKLRRKLTFERARAQRRRGPTANFSCHMHIFKFLYFQLVFLCIHVLSVDNIYQMELHLHLFFFKALRFFFYFLFFLDIHAHIC
jgi:hypothetical protein